MIRLGAFVRGAEKGYRIDDPELDQVLAYPSGDHKHLECVRRDLKSAGIDMIMAFGRIRIGCFSVLGKGCVGIVCLGSMRRGQVAVKVRRTDADRPDMLNEARMHAYANSVSVGPRLLWQTESALVMDYVNGLPIKEWLDTPYAQTSGRVMDMVSDLLDQCYRLDASGLDHGELSNSKRHALVEEGGKAVIIDFESASASRRARNVVAMTGYLFCRGSLENAMRRHFDWDALRLRRCLKEYKESRSARGYIDIREAIGLGRSQL